MNRLFITSAAIVSALAAMLVACSTESAVSDNGRSSKNLTVTQDVTSGNGSVVTRSVITDQGEKGLNAIWEMGDVMSTYNSNYSGAGLADIKAESTSRNTSFNGKVDCRKDDQLRFFYPAVSSNTTVTADNRNQLTLDISAQKGTLEDIQQRFDYNYGEATVSEVNDNEAKANAGSFTNLSTIVKFNFKYNGAYLKDIQRVEISGVANEATFPLAARDTPTLTVGTKQGITVEPTKALDNAVYVTLFPGETQPSFKVSTQNTVYAGTLTKANLKAGKYYNVTLTLTKTDEKVYHKDYVVVCGVKWARGNLVYDPDYSGDEGFREHWRIAPYQWYFGGYDNTEKFAPYDEASGVKVRDHFIIGLLGTESFADPNVRETNTAAGTMYTAEKDRWGYYKNIVETSNFNYAVIGDVSYYESNGKYRLPNQDEYTLLTEKASYQYGYVVASNGTKVYGMLFTTPTGDRVTNLTEREITELELRDGLFLPACGNVEGSAYETYNTGDIVTTSPPVSILQTTFTIDNSKKLGYYWMESTKDSKGNSNNFGWRISETGIADVEHSGTFLEDKYPKIYKTTNKYLNAIRPVFCGNE